MSKITRRTMIGAGAVGLAMPASRLLAMNGPAQSKTGEQFSLESDREAIRSFANVHEGLGTVGMRVFDFKGAAAPANFLIYEIPPGCSEGVHVHSPSDPQLGAFDEYYYIIEGAGRMPIGDEIVAVSAGDHIHTPMEVIHGIENTGTEMLRVFLTYIDRTPATNRPPRAG